MGLATSIRYGIYPAVMVPTALLVGAVALLTCAWIPRGNARGARVHPFHALPLPGDVAALFKEPRS